MVRQTRVIVNASILMLLFGSTLWLVRDSLAEQLGTLAVAATFGILHGAVYCWRLSGRIVCKTARFEPNEVPVKFLSIFEVGLVAAASGHYLMIVFGVLLLASIIAHGLLGHGLTVLIGSFAVGSATMLVGYALWYEHRHGRLHYQYDNRAWMGAEGMLYAKETVIDSLMSAGRILIDGGIWTAVSKSGEPIGKDETVEVLSIEGLPLHVDRVS